MKINNNLNYKLSCICYDTDQPSIPTPNPQTPEQPHPQPGSTRGTGPRCI